MTQRIRIYPLTEVRLDGELIVRYYARNDKRNRGECSIVCSTDWNDDSIFVIPKEDTNKTIMRYDGREFPVKVSTKTIFHVKTDERTEIHYCETGIHEPRH